MIKQQYIGIVSFIKRRTSKRTLCCIIVIIDVETRRNTIFFVDNSQLKMSPTIIQRLITCLRKLGFFSTSTIYFAHGKAKYVIDMSSSSVFTRCTFASLRYQRKRSKSNLFEVRYNNKDITI